MTSNCRLILYHKHSSSGRTLFLSLNGTVCQFAGISETARIVESHVGGIQVNEDLSTLLTDAEQELGMPEAILKIDPEFSVLLNDAEVLIPVYLAQFTTIDPPQELLAEQSGRFIALTEARRLPPVELELLRLAYSTIMDDLS